MLDSLVAIPIALLLLASVVAWATRHIRLSMVYKGWLMALFPAASFAILLWLAASLGDDPIVVSAEYLPAFNLSFSLYFDALSALFALLITGIGTLIIIYTGYYFGDDDSAWRFFVYLFAFMAMMLGLVLAGDLLTLFVFWEGTSITSFLLVAYKTESEAARRGAFKALFITGGGGIALLAGFLFVNSIVGGSDFTTILASGDALRSSDLYLVALGLVAFGAFTKSAQFPAHIWLPDAMSAPTPASAFLHSATMVKAGIYLLARLNPALGETEAWFWLLSIVGMATMLTGAFLGTKQNDLKALLAYSTIAQLGILVMLIGQDTEIAFKALVVGVVAHALFKSALFMLAGIVDHETGTREISRLGGLRRAMPVTFVLVVIVSLSLAGLPPMFGFLAKETLLATAVHPTLPMAISWIFIAAIVIAAAFKVVQAGLLSIDVFTGKPRDASIHAHEAPWGMLLAPAIPAILSLTLGILPEPTAITEFFGKAAAASYGDKVKVSFALWTGLNIPLALSVIAISLGVVLFWQRQRLIAWQRSLPPISFNQLYSGVMNGIDRLAKTATRTQTGQLRLYLTVIIVSMLGLVLYFGGSALMTTPLPDLSLAGIDEFDLLRILALIAIVGAAMATIALRRDFFAVLALSAAGLGVAVFMAIEPAPDVALVQIVVDILATVILMLALGRLPRVQRQATQKLRSGVQVRNLIVAVAGGLLVTMMTFLALSSRPRQSLVTPFYEANAKALTGASDIVGAIIVDFRALDTLIEITVFSLAGLGIYTLLRFAALKHDDHGQAIDAQAPLQPSHLSTLGIGGTPTSPYVGAMANILLPVALVIASVHVIYGHEQPGDGFTAGVIVSLAVGFKYVVFGFKETRRRLWWLRPIDMIVFGILLVIATGIAANVLEGSFLAPVDFGNLIGLPLPKGAKLSSGFLFEVAIASAVLGSMTLILDTLGRPAVDSEQLIEELSSQSNTANELQEVQT